MSEHADEGQVSETENLQESGEITPGDATAGSPDEGAQEGTAGPDAPPRHGIPEEGNESSR